MGILHVAQSIGEVMRAIPGPTREWTDLIGHLVWPGVALYLVTRYRSFLRVFLETLAARLRTDHVRIGTFELTPNSDVTVLDPSGAAESTENFAPDDLERIERLFEFIADPQGYSSLSVWMNEHMPRSLDVSEFLTAPGYATQREEAYRALVQEGIS